MRPTEKALSIQNSLDRVLKRGNEWHVLFDLTECTILEVGENYLKHQYRMGAVETNRIHGTTF